MTRKIVAMSLAGGMLGAAAWLSLPASADGTCGATAPTPSGTTVPLPDGGTVYANGSAGSASGSAGITGPHGYLYASGGASGGTIQGYNPDSGLNGKVTVPPSSASDVCIQPK
jgi:hypothetical protein